MLSLLMKAATFMLRKVDEDLEQDKYEAAGTGIYSTFLR